MTSRLSEVLQLFYRLWGSTVRLHILKKYWQTKNNEHLKIHQSSQVCKGISPLAPYPGKNSVVRQVTYTFPIYLAKVGINNVSKWELIMYLLSCSWNASLNCYHGKLKTTKVLCWWSEGLYHIRCGGLKIEKRCKQISHQNLKSSNLSYYVRKLNLRLKHFIFVKYIKLHWLVINDMWMSTL